MRTDGTYTISVRNVTWLYSTPTFFNADGVTYTAFKSSKELKLNATVASSGTDSFGKFQMVTFQYFAGPYEIVCAIKTYEGQPLVIFTQVS